MKSRFEDFRFRVEADGGELGMRKQAALTPARPIVM